MAARSKARKRAVDVLFEADQRGLDPVSLLAERIARADPPVPGYAAELVEGVAARRERIDELLSRYAEGWTLDRMPAVDRTVLRLGVWEALWSPDVPQAVAVAEAVALATSLSTDDSPRFVNGMLARVVRDVPREDAGESPQPQPPAGEAGADDAGGAGPAGGAGGAGIDAG